MEKVREIIEEIIVSIGKLSGIPARYPKEELPGGISITFTGPHTGSIVIHDNHVDRHGSVTGWEASPRDVVERLPEIMEIISEVLREYAHEKELWARVERIKQVI